MVVAVLERIGRIYVDALCTEAYNINFVTAYTGPIHLPIEIFTLKHGLEEMVFEKYL